MASFRSVYERFLLALLRGRQFESSFLRNHFKRHHDIDVGMYSYGAFDRWRIAPGTKIGRYCSIATSARIINANHPLGALSTHPLFYSPKYGLIEDDLVRPSKQIIEDDVWLGHNAIITPGCTYVGRGAVIGAGAIVTKDVPRYCIVSGVPARVARSRFEPQIVEAIEATQWWELDRHVLVKALQKAPDFALKPTVESAHEFYTAAYGRELALQ